MAPPGYGTMNTKYIGSWLTRETEGPMWALNLMEYREVAEYPEGQGRPGGGSVSGLEADNLYSPIEELASVGAEVVLVAPVVHQLRGDGTTWDRVAIALYPQRKAMIEMNSKPEFQERHVHKEAGMKSTIVMGTFPRAGDTGANLSAIDSDKRLLLQVVADKDAPDLAADLDSVRLAVFDVEGVIVGDERTFAEARWDVISDKTADELGRREPVLDDAAYVLVIDPQLDRIAEILNA